MKERGIVLFFLMIVLTSGLVLSGISLGDEESFLYTSYGPGENINGWVNLSVANERTDTKLADSEGNSITLLEWLESDSSISEYYSCVPDSCSAVYAPTGDGVSNMTFKINAGESKYVGFEFNGKISDISDFNFNISSDIETSCLNQLEIQLMDDPEIIIRNENSTSERCDHLKSIGCFDSAETTQNFSFIRNSQFCQKVYLYDSPGFYLGAWLKRDTGAKDTFIEVNTLDMVWKASCSLGGAGLVGETESSCHITAWETFTPGNYYICVYTGANENDENTLVRGYSDEDDGCGFFYQFGTQGSAPSETKSYDFYAQGTKFIRFGEVVIGTHTDSSLKSSILNYIDDIYGSNCEPCIIPIKFSATDTQTITVTPGKIIYTADGGKFVTTVTNITTQAAKVSTDGYQKISLNNINFSLPTSFKSFKYDLDLGTKKIFDNKDLTIERVPVIKSLYPLNTYHSFPTKFILEVEEANNISIVSYVWKIGNFTITKTTNTMEEYTFPYPGAKDKEVEVTITDENQKTATKVFFVTAISPSSYVNSTLDKLKKNYVAISNEITKMPAFEQTVVKAAINLTSINTKIQDIEAIYRDIDAGSPTMTYRDIVVDLMSLRVPNSIAEDLIARDLTFFPKREGINLEALESFHGGTHESSETKEYTDAIVYSYSANINGKISKKDLTSIYDEGEQKIASIYEIKLTPKTGSLSGQNLIMRDLSGLNFKISYDEQRDNNFVSIPLSGSEKTIIFSTIEDITYIDLPLFISPPLADLVIVGAIEEAEELGIKWALFILIIFFLLFAGLIVYIFLQHWYKTKYETYLFRERNFLFNLINYINDSKKKGVSERDIWKKLRQKGWTREQITYVLKKYVGKRTGMLELPVEKILNKIFGGSKTKITPQVPTRPGVVMPSSPGQPRGVPPRKSFSGRRMSGNSQNKEFLKK